MQTSEFITYMAERMHGDLSRANIRDIANRVQNEILSVPNRLTRIKPDPYVHTSSSDYTSHASNNSSGDGTFEVTANIKTTDPTSGYLIITDGTNTDKLKYASYSGAIFTLADGVTCARNYDSTYTATIDAYQNIASGSIFSSINNQTTQWDIRSVKRIYTFSNNDYDFRSYEGANVASYRPEHFNNMNSQEIEIPVDCEPSIEPDSKDCEITFWRENDPGNTTDVFIAQAYRWPAQVTTESIALTIPDWGQRNVLRFGMLADEEYRENGDDTRAATRYENALKEFQRKIADGSVSNPQHTFPRF